MYYHTPNVSKHIHFVRQFRAWIIILFVFLSAIALSLLRPEMISSDTLYWLGESKEYQKTQNNQFETVYVSRLCVDVPVFDNQSKAVLASLQAELEHRTDITKAESLFSSYKIYNDGGDESAMIRALPIHELNASKIQGFITLFPNQYKRFVDHDFKHFNFIIESKAPLDAASFNIPYSYQYYAPTHEAQLRHYLGYLFIFIVMIVIMSRWLFKNYIAAIGALSVTALTMILTFSIIKWITGHNQIHIAMTLMVLSVSIGHFLYFYYRWHVSQFKNDPIRAMEKSIDRNLAPALWTLPVLALSLGSLLFVDSVIIEMLSLSLLVSSALAYFINITFLPALLSYFVVEHPRVGFARMCYGFANREIHYSPRLLQLFIAVTIIIMAIIVLRFGAGSESMFDTQVKHKTITLKVPFEEIDLSTLQKLKHFESDLRHDNRGIEKVDSIQSVLNQLDMASSPKGPIDEQRLLQSLFFLELYDMEHTYIDNKALNITITLENSDHSAVIRWLKEYKGLPLYFTDRDTLSESAKMDKRIVLASSLFSALVMIGVVMGLVFRSLKIGFVGFIANTIPVIWFGLFMIIFNFNLSIEALIAMTISVGLTSDTIIHFAYKYFRSRYFGRTKKHALEIMFFYAGVPAIVGAVVLMGVFGLLSLTGLETLMLIGGYGVVMMFFSLVSDLFIFPVLLLAIDEKKEGNLTLRG
jgi:predicted RND superfamily exporter protein